MTEHKPKEECGIFGVSGTAPDAAYTVYMALIALQHRGQEGAGIALFQGNTLLCEKDTGLVSEIFHQDKLNTLPQSRAAIGHVRYSTTGGNTKQNTQPMIAEYLKGRIAIAHNGNILNAASLKEKLELEGCGFQATSDSEVIAALIANEALQCGDIAEGIRRAVTQIKGAFCLVILHDSGKLFAVRDGCGFRPLCLGKNEYGYAVASESCALDCTDFTFLRDIEPGEMVTIDAEGNLYEEQLNLKQKRGACIFEYIYFSRPDSVIDGLSVHEARFRMGEMLAKENPCDADLVCGVPDSGLTAAEGYSAASGLPCLPGFVKNRYIGRSFILPSQKSRELALKLKLNPMAHLIKGKRLVIIDDSIVRGTTSGHIIRMLREAGAKEIHLRISSPPFRHSCPFGTDIDSEENLAAAGAELPDLCKKIGADSLEFLTVEGLIDACKQSKLPFCTGCFDGNYPLPVTLHKKNQFE